MRYTLRLLTIQQFQRASALLCACEQLRERRRWQTWGDRRFTIGLWVGQAATPNSYEDSKDAIARSSSGRERSTRARPYQILYCPWCGDDTRPAALRLPTTIRADARPVRERRVRVRRTRFALGLPVLHGRRGDLPQSAVAPARDGRQVRADAAATDGSRRCSGASNDTARGTDISRARRRTRARTRRQRAHRAATVKSVGRLAPPDLVIQDELHLISGPLGTLVGLYEVGRPGAVHATRSTATTIRPKVVASTATIRRAASQVEALFGLRGRRLPAAGLEADRSFFARRPTRTRRPAALMSASTRPGKSVKTALVRVYATLLSRALLEFEADADSPVGRRT